MDAFWHVLNFFGPALGVAAWASVGAKLLWWRTLKPVSWLSLMLWATASCAVVSVGGLLLFGVDGKTLTYAGMVLACALSLWWRGFRPRPKAA